MSKHDDALACPNLFSLMDALVRADKLCPGMDDDALFDKAFELLEAAMAQREAQVSTQ